MAINNWRTFSSWDDALTALQNIVNTWYASGDDALNDAIRIVNQTTSPTETYSAYSNNTTTYPTFSVPETLKIQAQGYKDLGNDTLANAYNNLWTWSSQYDNVANQIWTFYNSLANDVTWRESMLANEKYKLAQQLNQDLLNSKDYVMGMFGPNGTLTNEVNKYYTDMWNYLATEAGREAANIAAQWVHSWASLWAIRAQQNEAYNNAYSRYLQAKEQEINAKQQIATNLINYMSTLRKEYWDTTNQYIISQYERANDLLNSISTDLVNQYTQLAWAQIRTWGSWGSSSSSDNPFANLLSSVVGSLLGGELGDATKEWAWTSDWTNFVATTTDGKKETTTSTSEWSKSNTTESKPKNSGLWNAALNLAKLWVKYL